MSLHSYLDETVSSPSQKHGNKTNEGQCVGDYVHRTNYVHCRNGLCRYCYFKGFFFFKVKIFKCTVDSQ